MTRRLALALAAPLLLAGCDDRTGMAMGDEHAIIVATDDALWAAIEDTYLDVLQPRIFAVRDEPTFRVSQASPASPHWSDLRRFRQILAVGRADDPWVAEPLRMGGARDVTAPAILEVDNVWARNQRVTVAVVPDDDPAGAARAMADSLASLLDARYRRWTLERMYTSGVNRDLADTLTTRLGFAVDMPAVYRWRQVGDSAVMFLNDQPDPAQLVRSLLIAWRHGTDGDPTVAETLDWRDAMAARFYDWPHITERDRLQAANIAAPGEGGIEVRGVWVTTDDFPQAGPFITRVVDCPAQNRRYLLDAWLYAPARAKYQYMLQLETLLGTFRCDTPAGGRR